MKITMVGTGYVGLVTGTCLAESGNEVVCVDKDGAKVAVLESGKVPIYEPGLAELVQRNRRDHRLRFTTNLAEGVSHGQLIFLAVGTPQADDGSADLSALWAVADGIAEHARGPKVVVVKSTVPVGTNRALAERLAKRASVDVASNPEFLKEGAAVDDFMRPDRVVVGVSSERARAVMAELYAPFVRAEQPVLFMDVRSAELTKYAANAMLATRISFMNEMATLCERLGADVDQVRRGVGSDRRIGHPFLFPGVGFGGSCFPKDVRAVMTMARQIGLDFDLLRAVERVNERQKRWLVEKAAKHFGTLAGKTIGVWGLAFKPKTDDMREAPAITVVEGLLGNGAKVRAHDPVAAEVAEKLFHGRGVELTSEPYAAAEGVDALLLVTEWNEFRNPDLARLKATMRHPVLLDGRNVWDAAKCRAAGFTYYGVGRNGAA